MAAMFYRQPGEKSDLIFRMCNCVRTAVTLIRATALDKSGFCETDYDLATLITQQS